MICTYECTYCRTCATEMNHVCKNCGGNLVERPSRPDVLLADNPPTTERVFNPHNCPVHNPALKAVRVVRASAFEGRRAWDSELVDEIDGVTVKLHWTDEPYFWHVNDGKEVFVVLDGGFDMYVRVDGAEGVRRLGVGDIFVADVGTEHVAHPIGPSRALVVERQGSV